jgi:hypothetical protein
MSPKEAQKEAIKEFPERMGLKPSSASMPVQDSEIPDDRQVVQEMHTYTKPNALEVKNADPNRVYRFLNRARVAREAGNTRGWIPIVAGVDKEFVGSPDLNIQEMLDEVMPDKLKNIPQQTGSVDTKIRLGDSDLYYQHKDWGESRKKTYLDDANRAVNEAMIRDKKDVAEIVEKSLREAGVSKSDARRYVKYSGGVKVVMTGRR